jgi:hypothetical protein
MTLQPALMTYLDRQIAAGLAPEQVRNMLRTVLDRWGAETDLDELSAYLYKRLRSDALLSETLRNVLARSLAENDAIGMPAEMDAQIRQQLFGQAAPADPPAPLVQGRDMPEMIAINTPWDAEIYNKVSAYKQAWEDSPYSTDRAAARRNMILWRAIERIMHLDFTALEELRAEQQKHSLSPEFIEQLFICKNQLLKMVEGIEQLVTEQKAGRSRG